MHCLFIFEGSVLVLRPSFSYLQAMQILRPASIFFFLLWTLADQASFAQTKTEYGAIDKVALQIPDSSTLTPAGIARYINGHFTRDSEKARAAFIWIATNIRYDIANMFALNFYEKKEEKIARPLRTRKGTCENYAALFTDICTRAGIRSYVVDGYTKQNGFADYIPHAWSAAYVDNAWYLFDPTWGSGYVSNGKFYTKIDNSHFRTLPALSIKTHMPFDYLWQFLDHPVTNQEFYEGRTGEDKSKPLFNYSDSIAAYERLDEVDAYTAEAGRIEKNGIKNSMIFDRLQHLRREVEVSRQNEIVYLYNSAMADYNKGVNHFNAFVNYYNQQFKPAKSDPEIQVMLDTTGASLKEASAKLDRIKNPDANTTALIGNFRKQIADLSVVVQERQDWLKKYFAKGKLGRRSMFYKFTWFGAPVN